MFYLLRQLPLPKAVTFILLSSLAVLTFTPVQAQTPNPNSNHIGLVIVHGNNQVITRCVAFSANEINGYELLSSSGLDLSPEIRSNDDVAICRIDNEGCSYPQDSCFCHCEGGACNYWSYWQWAGNNWQYSSLGAAKQIGHNGDVQGWRWGLGSVDSATAPPVIAFNDICTVTTTLTVTATSTVTATVTVTSTATATASTTPLPTASPTASLTPIPANNLPPATPIATITATNPPMTATNAPISTSVPATTSAATNVPTQVPAPGILMFSANPGVINAGESTLLTWRLVNAETAILRTGNGEEVVATGEDKIVGSKPITPTQTTVYTLVARSRGGEAATQVTITVNSLLVTPTLSADLPISASVIMTQAQPTATAQPTPALQTIVQNSPLVTPTATLAPVRFDLTPTAMPVTTAQLQADPSGQEQTQRLLLFSGVALAVILPLGIAGLGLLIWAIWRYI